MQKDDYQNICELITQQKEKNTFIKTCTCSLLGETVVKNKKTVTEFSQNKFFSNKKNTGFKTVKFKHV